jgi:hypothetical protein
MRYAIQLYVDGQRVEMFNDEGVSITSSIQNVKDIGKVFSDYSQSFSVPASKQNNKIFKHYYNPDVVNGFDARLKADAVIEINYQPFKTGKIRLDEVEMKDNKAYAYKLTFFGGLVSLKDLLGEDQLDSLNWLSNFDTVHSYDNVKLYLQNGRDFTIDSVSYTDAIVAPLISAEQRWYYDTSENIVGSGNLQTIDTALRGAYYKDFKYAIRVYCILKAIEKQTYYIGGNPYNIAFSNDFFNTTDTDFYNLYMWLHREKGRLGDSAQRNAYLSTMNPESWEGVVMSTDNFGVFDIGGTSGTLYYDITLNLDVNLSGAVFNVYLEKDGSVVDSRNALTGASTYAITFTDITQNGNYKIRIEHTTAFEVESSSDIFMTANFSGGAPESKTFTFTANQVLSTDDNFIITDNIPKIKVIDFLTGLFKMFNLTAYDNGSQIVVKPLDDFYEDGDSVDITKYVDSSLSTIMPSTLYNEILFKYSDTKTLFAENHLEQFNLEWAEEKYNIENKYDGERYEVSVPFSHHKFEKILNDATSAQTTIQWGWSVDKLNDDGTGQTYLGAPLVFYPVSNSGTSIRLRNDSSFDSVSTYYVPSNSVSLSSSNNINFKAELNEYTNTVFTGTLFENYYKDYISDVFDFRRRIIRVTAHLPLSLLSGSKAIKLEDEITLNQRAYRINQVTYNIGEGKADFELINIV